MTSNLLQTALLRLSQGQLNLWAACPRKFQHIYLDQLAVLTPPEQQERLQWGNRFHLLMQQRELGLPVEPLIAADHELQHCLSSLVAMAPEVFTSAPNNEAPMLRQSEHRRTLEFQGYLLTVIYDLVILEPQKGQILDWKTYPRPQNRKQLALNWQTRLYPFLLAETSPLQPEQISMTYWFVRSRAQPSTQAQPQSLSFTYSTALHEQTRQDLSALLTQLTAQLQQHEMGESLPQVSESAGLCANCHFAIRCQRSPDLQIQAEVVNEWPDLADIPEVIL
ncbi:MAG: PD-(D/E)XK nuclease family protein [Cyanothece sp. SIO1E1]|nr:PD-(D/E)XK nuclease family protein [Cyanothece sp. SIO1E1]